MLGLNSRQSWRSRIHLGVLVGAVAIGSLLIGPAAQAEQAPASTVQAASTVSAGIGIQNLNAATAANVQVTYYNADGTTAGTQSFPVPASGNVALYGQSPSLPCSTAQQAQFVCVPAGFTGSAVVSSDQPVDAIVNLLGQDPTIGEAYDGVSSAATTIYAPLFQLNNHGYNSELYIQDASGASNNVTVTFFANGTQVSQKTVTLAANGNVTYGANENNTGISGTFVGSVTITGSGAVAGEVNQTNGTQLYSYTALASTAGAPKVNLPLVMTNNHGYSTGVSVQNAGTQATTVSVMVNGTMPCGTANLAPGASVAWYPLPSPCPALGGATLIGSATITSNNGQPLLGAVNELNTLTGQAATYSGFGTGTTTVNMPLVMFNNHGFFTGEAIQNIGTAAATVDLKINGTVVNTQVIPPGQGYQWFSSTTNLIPGNATVSSAQAVAREPGSQIVGIVNEITSPQASGDTTFSYEGFNQ